MPLDLVGLLDPRHTAVLTQECQSGVIGAVSPLPELSDAAREILPNVIGIVDAARAAGAPVVHCVGVRRLDGRGASGNARIFNYMAHTPLPLTAGSPAAAVIPELGPHEDDFVLARLHGLSPFPGSELDPILRNLGVRTVVIVGVSVNVAVQNLTFDAVNAGYQVVLPRDAVAGWPREYVDAVFEHTLGAVATVISSARIIEIWATDRRDSHGTT
ncbi:MAG: yecD 1 [Acidimicrobiales bacterium]|nr:yecD 1 [Acidimicrobiales bacterium]